MPPKYKRAISTKNSYIKAIDNFNKAPNDLNTINIQKNMYKKNTRLARKKLSSTMKNVAMLGVINDIIFLNNNK